VLCAPAAAPVLCVAVWQVPAARAAAVARGLPQRRCLLRNWRQLQQLQHSAAPGQQQQQHLLHLPDVQHHCHTWSAELDLIQQALAAPHHHHHQQQQPLLPEVSAAV